MTSNLRKYAYATNRQTVVQDLTAVRAAICMLIEEEQACVVYRRGGQWPALTWLMECTWSATGTPAAL